MRDGEWADFARELQSSFLEFVRVFWDYCSTTPLVEGWYLHAICDHLQNLESLKRLVINIPPRQGKSTLVAVLYPAWHWTRRPQTKFLCSTYSLKDLSTRDSIACRRVIESPLYQHLWPVKLSPDQNTKTLYTNQFQGYRLATSTDSGNTGQGCDILVADDLNSVTKANSEADRQKVIAWWTQVMSTRMNPGGLDTKVVIQQRCHEDDITGYVLRQGEEWCHLNLPWEYDPSRRTVTPLPWQDPRTTAGEPLSRLYTKEKIEELKGGNGLGPTGFACQFNQAPAPAEGNVFKREWFGTWHDDGDNYVLAGTAVPKRECHVIITTDLAISLKTSADWTIGQVWAITPHNNLLLLDQWRERVEGPNAVKGFRRLCNRFHPEAIFIEDVAFQRVIAQLLRQENLPVRTIRPQGQDKKARAQRVLAKAECGQVWLPRASWREDWLTEVITFPNARHDDQVDAFSWAGIVAAKYPTTPLERILAVNDVQAVEDAFLTN